MDEQEQRELACKIFPEIKDVILDKDNCFTYISKAIIDTNLRDRIYTLKDIPSEWAYKWAYKFPEDREHMRKFVIESL